MVLLTMPEQYKFAYVQHAYAFADLGSQSLYPLTQLIQVPSEVV